MAAARLLQTGGKFLCAREYQNSLKDSVFAELERAIKSCWLADYYDVGRNYMRCTANDGEFLFQGLRYAMDSIKSTSNIMTCWVEEAETVTDESWRELIPTIREPGSEIWGTWNPKLRNSPTNVRFLDNTPPDTKIAKVNYDDNPWFPAELEAERVFHEQKYPTTYRHVWMGEFLEESETHPFIQHTIGTDSCNPDELYRVISIDHSQCVGQDYFVALEQGRDYAGNTHIIGGYWSNTADIPTRLSSVLSMIQRRRPHRLVCEDTSESRTFIEILKMFLRENDVHISLETPTAASRGSKNDYIVSWLVPLFNDGTYHCNVSTISDRILSEMYSFSLATKDNADDTLDTMASGVRYLRTPDRPERPLVAMSGIPQIDRQRQKLLDALSGKRPQQSESFI
jgi:hypothetical protein